MATRFIDHLLEGDHASRPAAADVPEGTLYSCSDHSLIYQSDTSSWSTWASLAGTGSVATDAIWNAAGDLAVGTGSDTAARLAIGATNGMALMRVSGAAAWALPSGHEFDYVQSTAQTTITATTEGTATTIVTANAVTYDGSTIVIVEGFFSVCDINGTAGDLGQIALYDGSSSVGKAPVLRANVTGVTNTHGVYLRYRITPSAAAHTYSWRGYKNAGTVVIGGGAGGAAGNLPAYIRQTKA